MKITSVPTFTATIYVGLKDRASGTVFTHRYAKSIIQEYVDAVGLCVSYTETEFIYTRGGEMGMAIGLINYPRFPSSPEKIRTHAIRIAEILITECKQLRVSIVMPEETIMLTANDD